MKYNTLKTIAVAALCAAHLALVPNSRALHATNFLDSYEAEVDARLAAENTNAADHSALAHAATTLNRRSATLQADLGLLAIASTALDVRFSTDTTFDTLEGQALQRYSDEAKARREALRELISTNRIPVSLSNQLVQVDAALERGDANTNSTPQRARAISFALTKLAAARNIARHIFTAPLSLEGQALVMAGREEDRQRLSVTLNSNYTYTIPAHGDEPEENGTFLYQRSGAKTATLTLLSTGGGTGSLELTFSNSSRGRFRGEDSDGEDAAGVFRVSNAH